MLKLLTARPFSAVLLCGSMAPLCWTEPLRAGHQFAGQPHCWEPLCCKRATGKPPLLRSLASIHLLLEWSSLKNSRGFVWSWLGLAFSPLAKDAGNLLTHRGLLCSPGIWAMAFHYWPRNRSWLPKQRRLYHWGTTDSEDLPFGNDGCLGQTWTCTLLFTGMLSPEAEPMVWLCEGHWVSASRLNPDVTLCLSLETTSSPSQILLIILCISCKLCKGWFLSWKAVQTLLFGTEEGPHTAQLLQVACGKRKCQFLSWSLWGYCLWLLIYRDVEASP